MHRDHRGRHCVADGVAHRGGDLHVRGRVRRERKLKLWQVGGGVLGHIAIHESRGLGESEQFAARSGGLEIGRNCVRAQTLEAGHVGRHTVRVVVHYRLQTGDGDGGCRVAHDECISGATGDHLTPESVRGRNITSGKGRTVNGTSIIGSGVGYGQSNGTARLVRECHGEHRSGRVKGGSKRARSRGAQRRIISGRSRWVRLCGGGTREIRWLGNGSPGGHLRRAHGRCPG
mmetsp:Transcript_54720/g.95691  ORF Transcript_54720/g.95691 Transcript_54720/m.95691 type:complete len:231 (+) Transcript_54720:1668-2360(+)